MNGTGFIHLSMDFTRYKLKNVIKRILLAFLCFWFVNYISIIVGLVSGHIDLSKIIVLDSVNEIYPPFFTYILSGSIAFRALIDQKTLKMLNYKHFCLFVVFIAIEMVMIYAFLVYWINTNIGAIRELEVGFTPWSVNVKIKIVK